MDTLYGILGFAVFIGIAILWNKGTKAAAKALSQKVLNRSEHKEGQEIVSQPISFETSASVSDIIKKLTAHVTTEKVVPALGKAPAIYELSRGDDRIIYAFGNKFKNQFRAGVMLTDHGATTKGYFAVLEWSERDGIVQSRDIMKKLRKQIQEAFTAADASVKITEGTVSNN